MSLLQHHKGKASILWCSAYSMVQFPYPYMTMGKTVVLTICTFVGKVMFVLFNMLHKLVIAFLSKSKHLNFMAAVMNPSDFGVQENRSVTISTFSFSCHEVMRPGAIILVFTMLSFKSAFHSLLSPLS